MNFWKLMKKTGKKMQKYVKKLLLLFCQNRLAVAMGHPITRSLHLPHIPVTAFSQTYLCLVWNYLEFRSPQELSDQLQSQARTNVDMSIWFRHIQVRPHCYSLTEACSCKLELAYFAGKISKNRLVCKNAVALAYYGSCRLLVMGSWHNKISAKGEWTGNESFSPLNYVVLSKLWKNLMEEGG